jgi:hypothetical protein
MATTTDIKAKLAGIQTQIASLQTSTNNIVAECEKALSALNTAIAAKKAVPK